MRQTVPKCIVIGAGHAGVSAAFQLRANGWQQAIAIYDAASHIPYQRPPLSKNFFVGDKTIAQYPLKPLQFYRQQSIELHREQCVVDIDIDKRSITIADGSEQTYTKLILAQGAVANIPPIVGLDLHCSQQHLLRNADDIMAIKASRDSADRVVVIGGGYIGLELAASLATSGVKVTVLEVSERILARVTSAPVSAVFTQIHRQNGVEIVTNCRVESIAKDGTQISVRSSDGAQWNADFIVLGTGVKPCTALAKKAGITVDEGVVVNAQCQTSNQHIYAAGDATSFYSKRYQKTLRLESVQNANEQGRVAAQSICGVATDYNPLPWFWSDQYHYKLQTVGLLHNSDQIVTRKNRQREGCSFWYFRQGVLQAVDAINDSKAYVVAMQLLKLQRQVASDVVANSAIDIAELLKN